MTDAPAPALKSRRFREEREADWRDLERVLAKLEQGSIKRLGEDELIALPQLYRSALSSLSTARAVSLDRALVDYLESLCTRAYFAVYGPRARPLEQTARFLARGWPQAVRRLWPETLVAAAITAGGLALGFALVRHDPDWFSALVPGGLQQGRDPDASAAALRQVLYGGAKPGLSVFASFLFTHNAQIALYAFALGFAFGAPTVGLLASNGASIGALAALYDAKGLSFQLWGWLLIHGVTELFATVLAGAAGLRVGVTLAFPGDRTRLDALSEEGRRTATVMAGVALMLVAAGLLEGFGRQLVTSDLARYGVAAVTAALWGGYFYGAPIRSALARIGRGRRPR